jgi:hypothetical protein
MGEYPWFAFTIRTKAIRTSTWLYLLAPRYLGALVLAAVLISDLASSRLTRNPVVGTVLVLVKGLRGVAILGPGISQASVSSAHGDLGVV